MNPSTELVTIAFARRQGRAMSLEPGRGTDSGLTQPEAACKWEAICKAVEGLPEPARDWAMFAYVDGGRPKMDQAGRIVTNVYRLMEWEDPKAWEGDRDTGWRKIAIINYVVRDTYKRRGIVNIDLARETGLPVQYFTGGRPWARFKSAVDECLEGWTFDMLTAVSYALDRKAA